MASREPGDRGARFAKRETLGYARPDRAFLVEREKLLGVARVALGIARREGAPKHADDLTGFQQREVERQFWNAGGKADDQETPLPADRAQGRFGIIAADGIVDHVGAFFTAGGLEEFGEFLLAVAVERTFGIDEPLVGAPALGGLDLLGSRRRGDDARAERLAEFHRRRPDASGGAQHQQRFARLQRAAVDQRVVGSAVSHQERRRLVERHGIGNGDATARLHGDFLRHAAPPRRGEHALTRLHVRHPLADGLDDARDLATRRERVCDLLDDQRFGAADGAAEHGFHSRSPLDQVMVAPPSMTMAWPVMKAPARDAKNTAAPAISSGSPMRPSGVRSLVAFKVCGFSHRARAKSVLTRPGAMQLTRMLSGPNSSARLRASWKSAALEML